MFCSLSRKRYSAAVPTSHDKRGVRPDNPGRPIALQEGQHFPGREVRHAVEEGILVASSTPTYSASVAGPPQFGICMHHAVHQELYA